MVGHGEFVEQIGEITIWLSLKPLPITINSLLKVLNRFRSLFLLQTIGGYFQVDMTRFREVLHHHYRYNKQ